jgi:hydroxyquinol 1,2-dioxygenase
MTAMTPGQLTEDVLAAYSGTPDPRLQELLAALVAHLHEFVVQTRLPPAEWQTAVAGAVNKSA